jgi:hypothetical protein
MPAKNFLCGPFSEVYVGEWDDETPLLRIPSVRTGGGLFVGDQGEEEDKPLPVKDYNTEQGKLAGAQMSLRFYGDHIILENVINGNALDEEFKDIPSSFLMYSFLFLHPNQTGDHHIYFPRARVVKRKEQNSSKTEGTTTPMIVMASDRNRHNQLYYKRYLTGDAPNDLFTIMGDQWPFQ